MPTSSVLGQLRGKIVDGEGHLLPETQRAFYDAFSRVMSAIDRTNALITSIAAAAKIQGRTEGIGTTVSALTPTGNLASTDNIAADGVGFPLRGGKKGDIALDTNNRIANSFRNNQLNVTSIPTTDAVLVNDGISTVINIVSNINQYGSGNVPNNLGAVDPGAFGSWSVFYDDPTYTGGAVIYQASSDILAQGANDGRQLVGTITTVLGTPFTGGGNRGGTGGGGGGHGYSKF